MVNTFLVHSDFRVSASCLDDLRLGKQRVEAYQILQIIEKLRFVACHFQLLDFPTGIDTPKELRKAWIDHVIRTFNSAGLVAMLVRGSMTILYGLNMTLPRKPDSGNQLQVDSKGIVTEVKGKRQVPVTSGHWSEYVLPGDMYITNTFGFWRHPAVLMWLGFEDALKDYINAHIEIWVSRGKVNEMQTYPKAEYKRPAWSDNPDIHKNFRSALIEREIERKEPAWYMLKNEFIESWVYSKEHGDYLRQVMASVMPSTWFMLIRPEQLLPLGKFPDFFWP